jgi:hypothetical protein
MVEVYSCFRKVEGVVGELLFVFEFILGRMVVNPFLKMEIVIGNIIFSEFLKLLLAIQRNSIEVSEKIIVV